MINFLWRGVKLSVLRVGFVTLIVYWVVIAVAMGFLSLPLWILCGPKYVAELWYRINKMSEVGFDWVEKEMEMCQYKDNRVRK